MGFCSSSYYFIGLSYFQCYKSEGGEDDADNPETDDNLALVDGHPGLLYQRVHASGLFLEVVVQRRHLEDALAVGELEIGHLYHHRQVLDVEQGAEDG